MKKVYALAFAAAMSLPSFAFAADDYNAPPAGDSQYAACIVSSNKTYEGGDAKSPVAGQTKAQAFCRCVWNETPEDFRGDLAKFADSGKGKTVNAMCEKHSGWGG